MSLISAVLYNKKPTIVGQKTTFLAENYRDSKLKQDNLTADWKPESKKHSSGHQHMVDQKNKNIALIKSALVNGPLSQKEIHLKIKMEKGTLSTRIAGLAKDGEVAINKNEYPWQYSLADRAS